MKEFLQSAQKQFEYYKMLGEKAIAQVSDEQLAWQHNEESNSIAIIVQHLAGNMFSRWTDIFTTDGEKPWRKRDEEFVPHVSGRGELMQLWENGWKCLLDTLGNIKEEDYDKPVYIRNQGHSITEAVNRQLCHYAYHVGQIVFIAKLMSGANWQSLSIPRGKSVSYNNEKFAAQKEQKHFTDEFLK